MENTLVTDAYPYETAAFHSNWWMHLASKFRITDRHGDLLIHRKPLLRNMLWLNEMRIAGWNNPWPQDLTPERVASLEALRSQNSRWDYFRMTWNAEREKYQAFQLLDDLGFTLLQIPVPACPVIDLSQGWDSYMKRKSYANRKEVRRRLNNAAELNPELFVFTGPNRVERFFEEFFPYHISYWDEKTGYSYFNDPREQAFIIAWAKALEAEGHLLLHGLRLNNETVNLSMSIVMGNSLFWIFPINTGIYLDYCPGMVSLYLQIQEAVNQGIQTFHMGPGVYPYKMRASTHQEKCYDLVVFNPASIPGRLYTGWLKHRLKSFVAEPEKPCEP